MVRTGSSHSYVNNYIRNNNNNTLFYNDTNTKPFRLYRLLWTNNIINSDHYAHDSENQSTYFVYIFFRNKLVFESVTQAIDSRT